MFSRQQEFVSTCLLVLLFLACIVFLTRGIYRLFFHPLAKFPGPWIAAVSDVWYVRAFVSGRYPWIIQAAHRKYGDVVRIAPNELSFASAQAYQDIYGHAVKGRETFVKSDFYYVGDRVSGITATRDPVVHQKQRRMFAPAFSTKSLRDQETVIHTYIDAFLQQIGQIGAPHGPGINMSEAFVWLTFDIIGDLAFGESFGAVAQGQATFWVSMVLDATYMLGLLSLRRRFRLLNLALPFVVPLDIRVKFTKHRELTRAKVLRRVELSNTLTRDDFLSHVLTKGDGMSEEELRGHANSLIIAGSETSSTLLTAATYHLLKNRDCLDKLTEEVRSSFTSIHDINGTSTSALPYIRAVIDETLRIFPPATFGLPRTSPGAHVDGHYVAAGAVVGVTAWVTHHDERYWHDAGSFKPERWIGDGSGDNKDAFQPFSLGPRSCIGVNLAYLEIRIVLAKMVWMYDWELVNQDVELDRDSRLRLLWKTPKVIVRYHPRI